MYHAGFQVSAAAAPRSVSVSNNVPESSPSDLLAGLQCTHVQPVTFFKIYFANSERKERDRDIYRLYENTRPVLPLRHFLTELDRDRDPIDTVTVTLRKPDKTRREISRQTGSLIYLPGVPGHPESSLALHSSQLSRTHTGKRP